MTRIVWVCQKNYFRWSYVNTHFVFTMGRGPGAWQKSHDLMTNNRISTGKMVPWVFFHIFKFNTRGPNWATSGSKWNIESLVECRPRFVLKLQMWKTEGALFPIDILLLVMRSEEIVWHLGLHPIVNTTCGTGHMKKWHLYIERHLFFYRKMWGCTLDFVGFA